VKSRKRMLKRWQNPKNKKMRIKRRNRLSKKKRKRKF